MLVKNLSLEPQFWTFGDAAAHIREANNLGMHNPAVGLLLE